MNEIIIEHTVNQWYGTHIYQTKITRDGHVYRLRSDNQWHEVTKAFGKPVYIIILETFHGPRPNKHYLGCHRDDDISNNHADNLYWGTRSENGKDAVRNGRKFGGKGTSTPLLSEEEKREVNALYKTGEYTHQDLADFIWNKYNANS